MLPTWIVGSAPRCIQAETARCEPDTRNDCGRAGDSDQYQVLLRQVEQSCETSACRSTDQSRLAPRQSPAQSLRADVRPSSSVGQAGCEQRRSWRNLSAAGRGEPFCNGGSAANAPDDAPVRIETSEHIDTMFEGNSDATFRDHHAAAPTVHRRMPAGCVRIITSRRESSQPLSVRSLRQNRRKIVGRRASSSSGAAYCRACMHEKSRFDQHLHGFIDVVLRTGPSSVATSASAEIRPGSLRD